MSFEGWSKDEKHLYFVIKEQTIKYLRKKEPFTYQYRLSLQGTYKHNVPTMESFWEATNKGLDHYNSTKHLYPKHATYNSCRAAAYSCLDFIVNNIESNKPYEEDLE